MHPSPSAAAGRGRALCAALAFAWAAFACPGAGPSDPAPGTIVFFGDSLTAGYGLSDPVTQSFPAQVQALIDAEHLPWRVVNAGLSGETSAGGLRRIDWVLGRRPDIVVLELGGNDGLRGIAPEVTQANLQGVIGRIREKCPSARILIAGMRMPTSMGEEYSEAFARVYPALAARNSATLIPFLLEGVGGRPELNQADGIHPTAEGARRVARNVWRVLRPLLLGVAVPRDQSALRLPSGRIT
jgi:acyl-CoA thioesterase-1